MSFYNTGNPVPSNDPRDLDDNAMHIDEVVNSAELSTTDRQGRAIRTLAGLQYDASQGTLRTDLAEPTGAGLVGARLLDDDYVSVQEAIDYRVTENKIFTVGSGGMFSTVSAALERCSRIGNPVYKSGGITVEVRLLPGFELREQTIVDGINLGFVLITASDPSVRIDHTVIASSPPLTTLDFTTPAFGGRNFAVLPVLGCLFHYDANTLGCDGVAVHYDSKARFLPGAGILNCRRGLQALYTSDLTCYANGLSQGDAGSGAGSVAGVRFSNTLFRSLHVAFNSTCGLARSDFSGCKSTGETVYGIWGAILDIYQSNMANGLGEAVYIRDGAVCNARETQVAGSVVGYHALHEGRINARSRPIADGNPWVGNGAKNCTQYGVLCSYGSRVEAANLDVSGCPIGVNVSNTSSVNFYQGIAENCSNTAILSIDVGKVGASGAKVDGSGTGFYADLASTINADGVSALNCTLRVAYATGVSTICLDGAVGSLIGGSALECVFSARGANIGVRGAVMTGGTHGYRVIEGGGGGINAYSAKSIGASIWGFAVERGGIISAGASVGTANVAVNTISSNGIIFK